MLKESIKGAVPHSCPEEQPKAPKVGVSTLAIKPLGCTQFKVQATPLRVTVRELGGKGRWVMRWVQHVDGRKRRKQVDCFSDRRTD